MSIKIKGLDKLQRDLNKMERDINQLFKQNSVSFEELFTERFMKKNTNVVDFDNFLKDGGFHVESEADFEAIPENEFDAYVSKNTKFSSWEEMLGAATEYYLDSKLRKIL